jgi:hypothetical protein
MLMAAVAGHDLDDLTLTAGLTDVNALDNKSVTPNCVHGNPPFRGLRSSTHTAWAAEGELPLSGALIAHAEGVHGLVYKDARVDVSCRGRTDDSVADEPS